MKPLKKFGKIITVLLAVLLITLIIWEEFFELQVDSVYKIGIIVLFLIIGKFSFIETKE